MIESPELAEALAEWFGPDKPVIGSLVGGELMPGDGAPIELIDPATESRLAAYPDGGADAAAAAVDAARTGGDAWRALTASARGAVLWRIGLEVRRRAESLARLESLVAGKPIRDCRAEVDRVAQMFAYYAGWADKLHGEVIPVPTSHLNYTRREPYGTVAQITPWNAPLFTAGWQVAPALATGNAVVLKPSELTPVTSLCLAKLALAAGLPPGALNV
ncbi:MAG TPA: aldehyde dehydrogenase family protein, partial [Geminicoccaceae bacterium]|nr:aldehyde dehydrogenase family protein [Geminicoccaceae bacterium]